MANINFISYNGRSPNLCSGTLTFAVDGKVYALDYCLCSGGSVWFDDDWMDHVESGPWSVHSLPVELDKYRDAITDMVNENVPWGCCGGCV